MENNDIHRRSYGYEPEEEERSSRTYGNTPMKEPNKQPPKKPFPWKKAILFIFVLLGRMVRNLFSRFKKRKKRSKQEKGQLYRRLLRIGMVLFAAFAIFSIGVIAWASKDLPDPDKLTDRNVAQSTKIYDRTGEHLLYEIYADEKRTVVDLDQIPKHLINGVIATEDTAFYEHHGIRPLSIGRAVFVGVFTDRRIEGTSTLTQQLVKNAILSSERTATRKLKEMILSLWLEQKYDKDQILKIYFNEIPYGSTNYGAEAAAQSYFGKPVSELDLQESATLAGLPQQPSRFLANKDRLKQRRDFVLRRMHEEGYITEEEKVAAQEHPITLERHFSDIKAPHFVLYVKDLLVEEYGEQMVDTGGLKVITSLDWEKQQMAEQAIEDVGTEALKKAGANNTALVSLDARTGQVLALVGSKNFYDESIDGQFNVATLGKRQPGSSIKPIFYAAAFEKGYTPETVIFDVLTTFPIPGSAPYNPRNYSLQEYGPVNLRKALQGSLNITAVKVLYLVGQEKALDFAERLGYTTFKDNAAGLSLVLGGGEVSMMEHTNAFATFANKGERNPITPILKIEDAKKDVIFEWKKKKGDQVINEGVAATISNVMSDDGARAYIFGTRGLLTLPGRPVAAKTGTTNNFVDSWTVGYTPSMATVVWAGNTNNTPMNAGFGGGNVSAPIWNAYMKKALDGAPVEQFPAPPKNTSDKPVLNGSLGGEITLDVNRITGKLASSSTPENLIVKRTYIQPHDILHYVDKDNPRGPVPKNPESDPYYTIWEQAVQDWIARVRASDPEREFVFEEPPTEYDDEYSLELIPTLNVLYPSPGTVFTSRQLITDIQVSAVRGVSRVTYRIDQKPVQVVTDYPFNLNYFAENLEPGEHILKITVEDDIGNSMDQEITFTLDASETQATVSWVNGATTLSTSDLPYTLFLNHHKLPQIQEVQVYAQKDGQDRGLVATLTKDNMTNDKLAFQWTNPETGRWTLFLRTITKKGDVINGSALELTIQ